MIARVVRGRFPLLYAGFYFVVAAVLARTAGDPPDHPALTAAGVGLFAAIALVRDSGRTALSRKPSVYLGLQAALVSALLVVDSGTDWPAILFVLLSLQAILFLPAARGYLWLGVFTLLTAAIFFVLFPPDEAIPFILTYCGAYMFFGLAAKAVVESEAARATSEGLLLELREKEARLRELAVSEERNRLAREIHDTLAQGFTGIVLQLEAAEHSLQDAPQEAASRLAVAKNLARESLQEARRSVWNLLPRALEEHSIEEALRNEVRRFAAEGQERTSFNVRGDPAPLPAEAQGALLRVCQESLTNVRKHAAATQVSVTLAYNCDSVRLQVVDNGVGISASGARDGRSPGRGLAGMEERAHLLGGRFLAEDGEAGGTRVVIEVPLAPVRAT